MCLHECKGGGAVRPWLKGVSKLRVCQAALNPDSFTLPPQYWAHSHPCSSCLINDWITLQPFHWPKETLLLHSLRHTNTEKQTIHSILAQICASISNKYKLNLMHSELHKYSLWVQMKIILRVKGFITWFQILIRLYWFRFALCALFFHTCFFIAQDTPPIPVVY